MKMCLEEIQEAVMYFLQRNLKKNEADSEITRDKNVSFVLKY